MTKQEPNPFSYEGEEKIRELASLSLRDNLCLLCTQYRRKQGEPPAAFLLNISLLPAISEEDKLTLCSPIIPMIPTKQQFFHTAPGSCVVQLIDEHLKPHVEL